MSGIRERKNLAWRARNLAEVSERGSLPLPPESGQGTPQTPNSQHKGDLLPWKGKGGSKGGGSSSNNSKGGSKRAREGASAGMNRESGGGESVLG